MKRKQLFDLAAGGFVRQKRDVLLVGPPGVGKSHLVQALGLALAKAGFTVLYRSIFDAVRDLLHDEAFEGHDRVMAKYLQPDLLILDDMGMKQLPKRSGEYLFEIIMRRHQLKSTMMTSNRPLEDWGQVGRGRSRRHGHSQSSVVGSADRADYWEELSSAQLPGETGRRERRSLIRSDLHSGSTEGGRPFAPLPSHQPLQRVTADARATAEGARGNPWINQNQANPHTGADVPPTHKTCTLRRTQP